MQIVTRSTDERWSVGRKPHHLPILFLQPLKLDINHYPSALANLRPMLA